MISGKRWSSTLVACMLWLAGVAGCSQAPLPTQRVSPTASGDLVLYDWTEDKIETVFDDFERETGIHVRYEVYESQEEAIENIRAGKRYDVVVMENQFIPNMAAEGLLKEIDFRNIPNFKNISPNFRGLLHDPENRYTIPYSWGTFGILVRTDLVTGEINFWSDLWDPAFQGKLAMWESVPRYTMGAALLTLGYSINTEDPRQLNEAADQLIKLKPYTFWLSEELSSAPRLVSGQSVIAPGWSEDVWLAQEKNENVIYVLPEEGTILWGDNFIIPSTTANPSGAELFMNFILKPEISAEIINRNYYPMANDAALPYIKPEVYNDPVVYPSNRVLQNAQILLPLSPEGQKQFDAAWGRFLAAGN